MKSFLIIGMGSFGHHLCRSLSRRKCEIMVVDRTGEAVEDILSLVVSAKIGDCTKKEVLEAFDVGSFDGCFVCMGSNFQNSLQITSLLKELGAKRVLSKADEDIHAKFLLRNGADVILYPERHIAEQIAIEETGDNIFECVDLGAGYFVMEIAPRREWIGKSIGALDFRNHYHLNIMAVKQKDTMQMMPDQNYVFGREDHILVLGREEHILKLTER